MPLGLTMHGKWDGISMASPQLHSYKHERPAYSTPQPVENTPANNECRMVELRGAKVASFFIGGEEFICLPQAFDLFLKHLVGGLHTVYTKLKRLSISPVVCNVEQVRILRGLGAIQPGVNRCKLITRKDFEILYQDCTQASRPGRPPKRYPMLPPTTDLISHHAGMRSMNAAHGLLSASDFSSLHKRMRLDQDIDMHLHQRQERRTSDSSNKDSPPLSGKDLAMPGTNEVHANAANLYLQAQQALRQQYQQVAASGIHNGLDPQHAAAAAGINPALTPLMMMSHPGLFPGGLPPSSMAMLSHINQFAQSHSSGNAISTAAAAAAAQIAANGGNVHQQAAAAQAAYQVAAAAQSAAQASMEAAASAHNSPVPDDNRRRSSSGQGDKDSDCEEVHTPRSLPPINHVSSSGLTNGIGSDGCTSPHSSISSALGENMSEGSLSFHSDSADSNKDLTDVNEQSRPQSTSSAHRDSADNSGQSKQEGKGANEDEGTNQRDVGAGISGDAFMTVNAAQPLAGAASVSSMQTLLTNIQGLLKVAADNARLQEKHCSFEIADLKAKVSKERQMRSAMEKRYQDSERIRSLIQKRLKKERKVRKILQEQLLAMQRQLGNESDATDGKIGTVATTPITGVLGCGRENSLAPSPKTTCASTIQHAVSSPSTSVDIIPNSSACSNVASSASSPVPSSPVASPKSACGSATFLNSRIRTNGNSNNSSNNGSSTPPRGIQPNAMSSTLFSTGRRASTLDPDVAEVTMTNGDHGEQASLTDHHMWNVGRFQSTPLQ